MRGARRSRDPFGFSVGVEIEEGSFDGPKGGEKKKSGCFAQDDGFVILRGTQEHGQEWLRHEV